MKQLKEMLYLNQKFNILKMKVDDKTSNLITDAYAYAWDNNIYPLFDEGAPWHKCYEGYFNVSEIMITELSKYLDENWLNKKLFSFYDLEDHYNLRHSPESGWDRFKLIHSLRYMYLSDLFDKSFWDKMLESGNHPTEAASICSKFHEDMIYFN